MPIMQPDDPFLGVMAQMLAAQKVAVFKEIFRMQRDEQERKAKEFEARLIRDRQQAEYLHQIEVYNGRPSK